jgi:outer membrane protein OmpA-like peptidoglycan-associated protein
MKQFYVILIFGIFLSNFLWAQQNPPIDRKTYFTESTNVSKAKKDLRIAEKYYLKGMGTYDEALKHFLKLYQYNPVSHALNYKIGVCYLFTANKKASLPYFLNSSPETAKDYYLLLGRSYQFNLKFDDAKASFSKYMESLSKWKQFDFRKEYNQLQDECNTGKEILQDSLSAFIINLGPIINSYYDEYGAYLPFNDTTLYLSSKRPEVEPRKRESRFKFSERLLVTNNCVSSPARYAVELPKLEFTDNTSLAGVDMHQKRIFIYRGGTHNGQLYSAKFNGKKWKKKLLKGSINHIAYKETTISMADDGTTYYVTNRRGGQGGKDIWVCRQVKENKFKDSKNLGSIVNTAFDEEGVFVTADGNTLYFSSKGRKGMGGFDVYKTTKDANGMWTEPINMGHPINSPADELFYHPTADTMVALYSTIRGDSYGGMDIYKIQIDPRIPFKLIGSVSDSEDGSVIPAAINVYDTETQRLLQSTKVDSLAGIYMLNFEDVGAYFITVDYDGYKSVTEDIVCPQNKYETIVQDFRTEKLKHPFTLIGQISDVDRGNPLQATLTFKLAAVDSVIGRAVSADSTGKYSITFEDKFDMVMDIAANDYFSILEPINTTNEPNSIISKSIALKRSKIDYTLTGRVTQEDASIPVHAALCFYAPGVDDPFAIIISDSTDGKYSATIDNPGPFLMEIEAQGYFFLNETYQFPDGQTFTAKNFVLKKMETGVKFVVDNILFNSGKATLAPESFKELDKLADLLLKNASVRIEVSGHTDNVGSASVNKRISKSRALTVKNYLVSRGVEQDRIEYEGYGFEQPIATNDTPEGKAKNRRVEMKILQ